MRDKLQLHDPEQFNYEEEVKSILSSTEEHMSVKDIRTELNYRQNGLEPTEDYSLDDMDTAIEEVLTNVIEHQNKNGEIDMTKKKFIGRPLDEPRAEVEYTEIKYKII